MKMSGESGNNDIYGAIHVYAGVRYCEDAMVDGIMESETDPKMPFLFPSECEYYDWEWRIDVDVETGRILGWPGGVTARTFYKVCDCFRFKYGGDEFFDYVPKFMALDGNGFGDYVNVTVNSDGTIDKWRKSLFLSEVERLKNS